MTSYKFHSRASKKLQHMRKYEQTLNAAGMTSLRPAPPARKPSGETARRWGVALDVQQRPAPRIVTQPKYAIGQTVMLWGTQTYILEHISMGGRHYYYTGATPDCAAPEAAFGPVTEALPLDPLWPEIVRQELDWLDDDEIEWEAIA